MQLFALTTMEKLQRVPVEFWLKIAMVIAIFVLTVVLIRGLSQVNKVVLTVCICVIVTVLGFHWVYERNEPRFLTPLVDTIAPFFPSKGVNSGW